MLRAERLMSYPRVTEVLRWFTSYDQVPKEILERAAARGTTVHALCAGIAKGEWIPDGMIGEDNLGYVNSFKKWCSAQVKKFVIIEKRYMDDTLQYSGQVDMVVMCHDNELYLVDIKTSARPQRTYPIQLAAYKNLLHLHNVPVIYSMLVYLKKDGEFPSVDLHQRLEEEMEIFQSSLKCWHYFNKGKKNDRARDTSDSA